MDFDCDGGQRRLGIRVTVSSGGGEQTHAGYDQACHVICEVSLGRSAGPGGSLCRGQKLFSRHPQIHWLTRSNALVPPHQMG